MGQNQAVLVTYLRDILFSEKEILKNVDTREHIFEMCDDQDRSVGFISLYDLKAYVYEHEDEAGHYKVKNIDATEWTFVFEHPFFQRRKPQLVTTPPQIDNDQQFFILKHGQKTGPYAKAELNEMLEEKHILLTDMVSYNGGHTWMKLFQVENFDRRVLKDSEQLPGVPKAAMSQTSESTAVGPETQAISSLAYLSNVKRGKSVEREKNEIHKSDKVEKVGSSAIYKWLLVGSMIGIGYFLFHIKNQLNSPFKGDQQNPIGEQAQMLTPVESTPNSASQLGERSPVNQVNDQRRSGGKFEARTLQPIRPTQRKSFMESGKYQEIKNDASASDEDPNYFYDNTSAMELDPVRSQVSKENFDDAPAESEAANTSADNLFDSEVSN